MRQARNQFVTLGSQCIKKPGNDALLDGSKCLFVLLFRPLKSMLALRNIVKSLVK